MTQADSRTASAGRRGDDVRSDVWIELELLTSGGIQIELRSRVEPYYGEAIRAQARGVLADLGVPHARIAIDDTGALPFVIAARIEAAVRRCGAGGTADGRRPDHDARPSSSRRRTRRSRLYLPGNEPKYLVNAGLYRPDAVILDLEDSVHPAAKDAARLLVRNALREVDFGPAERTVRINQGAAGRDDLAAVIPEGPEMILLPKVETADQVCEAAEEVDRLIGDDRPLWLMPILESALGIENALAIARASQRVAALTLGLEDYAADLGVPRSTDGAESDYARRRVVNAARAAGIQAIDSVYGQVDDLDGLRTWAAAARRLGFKGMGCLHPRQIPVIHDAFNPSAAEIERAVRIVEAFREAEDAGLGVVSLGSKMIDPPVVQQALRLVEQARELGLLRHEPTEIP